MSGIDPGRVAEVLVTPRWAGPGRRGSGHRVSGSAVLTAAHVVHGAARVRVRFDADQPGEWITDAEVAWSDDGADAAVLTLAGEAGGDPVPEAGFGRVAAADAVLTCSAVGFPRFKLRRDPAGPGDDSPSQYRDSVHATGTIAVLSNRREGTLEVIVAAPERDDDPARSPWEGMSGAAVWSAGQIIGVVTEHHRSDGLGRLAASRVDRWYAKLTGRQGGALRRLLPWLPVTPGELTEVVPATEAERLQAGYLAQVRDIAPAELIGRDTELAKLVRFCAGPDAYTWWQAGPWAGKSALAAWFVLHPPAGTVIASFFVTSRLTGQADSDAFTEAMIEQLAAIAGEPVTGQATPAGRDRERRRLLEAAAARVAARQQRLVLVIDGLDEDVGPAASGLPSIASLLPRNPDPVARILITSRPHPGLPSDVPDGHPLRHCERYELAPSSLARDIQYEARNELLHRLRGDRLQVDVIGFITAAGGGLTLAELAELTAEPYWTLKGKLGSVFGRSLLTRQSYDPPTEDPEDRVYLFAHETLRVIAEHELAHDLGPYRERLHAWADSYRSQGWPETTPRYLLRPYGRMLATTQDLGRLVSAATDAARQDRMLAWTFSDANALAEVAAAQQLILAQASQDLMVLARLAISRDRLENRNRSVPPELISLWARLGEAPRAEALARSLSEPGSQAEALSSIVAALPGIGRDHALRITAEAEQLAGQAGEPQRTAILRVLAQNAAGAGHWDIAAGVARSLPALADLAEELCTLATRTGISAELAAGLVAEALDTIRAAGPDNYHRSQAVLRMISGLASAGMLDQAEQAASLLEAPADRIYAAGMMIDGLLAAERWDDAEQAAYGIRSAGQLATVALAVAGFDRGRARRLAVSAAEEALAGLAEADLRAGHLIALAGRALAAADPALATKLAVSMEASARDISDHEAQAMELVAVARLRAAIDLSPAQALALAAEAVQLAMAIGEQPARDFRLRRVSTVLAEGGLLTPARQAATAIDDPVLRHECLGDVAARLGRAGRGEEAIAATAAMTDPGPRREARQQVVEGLTEAGQWAPAELAAREIPDVSDRGQARCVIVRGLAGAGRIPEAERLARSVPVMSHHLALMLATVGAAVAATDPQKARSLADEADRTTRAAQGTLSRCLALAGAAGTLTARDRQSALRLAAAAEHAARALSATEQSRGLSAVAAALADLDRVRARDLASEAVSLASQLPGLAEQASTLGMVAEALAGAGFLDESTGAAQAVRNPGDQAEALALVAAVLARTDPAAAARLAQEALRTASLVPRTAWPDICLTAVAQRLVAAGLIREAQHAAERIRGHTTLLRVLVAAAWDPGQRTGGSPGPGPGRAAAQRDFLALCQSSGPLPSGIAELLTAEDLDHSQAEALAAGALDAAAGSADGARILPILAAGLGIAGHWEYARRAALASPDRDRVLISLITGMIAAQEWQQAEATAGAIESPPYRASAAAMIAAGLARSWQWGRAHEIAQAITDPPDQAFAYGVILAELAAAPDPEDRQGTEVRRVVAAGLCGPQWPSAIKLLALLDPANAATIGEVLVRAPGG